MESYPTFHNEVGVPIVRIGCREFKCIGDKPPQDHPHIYLNMGDASEIVCPYCSTLFRLDPRLGAHEADPADCAYEDFDTAQELCSERPTSRLAAIPGSAAPNGITALM